MLNSHVYSVNVTCAKRCLAWNLNTSVYTIANRAVTFAISHCWVTRIEDEFTGIAFRGTTRVQHFQLLRASRKFHTKSRIGFALSTNTGGNVRNLIHIYHVITSRRVASVK